MLTAALSMFSFALVGAITPGPVNIIATSSGASFGALRTLPLVTGATLGYVLVVLISGIGINTLGSTLPRLTTVLQYLGGAFLLYLAYKISTSVTDTNTPSASLSTPPTFMAGALAQLLNPKAWLVAMSGVALFVSTQISSDSYLMLFCAISFIACFIGVATWAVSGQLISHWLNTPTRLRFFNRALGVMLALTVTTLFMEP